MSTLHNPVLKLRIWKSKASSKLVFQIPAPEHEPTLALLSVLTPLSCRNTCPCASDSLPSAQIPCSPSERTGNNTSADTAEHFEIPHTEVFKMFYTKEKKSIHPAIHRHCKLAGQHCQGKKWTEMSRAVREMANFWEINLPQQHELRQEAAQLPNA